MRIDNLTPACGSIVTDVDLSQQLTNQDFDTIHAAFADRTVLIFPDQDLTEEQHIAFTRRFGSLQKTAVSAFQKNRDYDEIDILEYDADHPPHATQDLWHTDFAGRERPTLGTTLYARDIPEQGGDTIWVSAAAAYDALSERMKTHLEGLWAYHDNFQPYDKHKRPDLWTPDNEIFCEEFRGRYTPALHPVVRRHPVTGRRGLFVNESMTTHIKDMDRRESHYLLQFLFDWLRSPEFHYRHKWTVKDLAVWDNRLSLHYALFDYTEHRLMHRIVIDGDRPYE